MSKLYMMNRMAYSPAAGGILEKGIKFIGGLFSKKKVVQAVTTALPVAKKIAVGAAPGLAAAGAFYGAEALLGSGGGGGGRGASGGWGGRRRRGITATELRGYRKVANLIHKEGMVSKRARGRKVC